MPLSPASFPAAEELLPALLDLSLAGIVCYTPVLDAAGQAVDFAARYVGERVELAVQDDGLRLDAGQQSKFFRLFKRLHTHVAG